MQYAHTTNTDTHCVADTVYCTMYTRDVNFQVKVAWHCIQISGTNGECMKQMKRELEYKHMHVCSSLFVEWCLSDFIVMHSYVCSFFRLTIVYMYMHYSGDIWMWRYFCCFVLSLYYFWFNQTNSSIFSPEHPNSIIITFSEHQHDSYGQRKREGEQWQKAKQMNHTLCTLEDRVKITRYLCFALIFQKD